MTPVENWIIVALVAVVYLCSLALAWMSGRHELSLDRARTARATQRALQRQQRLPAVRPPAAVAAPALDTRAGGRSAAVLEEQVPPAPVRRDTSA